MERSAQNPGFFVSGGQVFLSSFLGSLSRRVNSSSQEHRTAECSLRVSRSLQPRGRWARSGKNAFGRSGAGSSGASRFDEREHFAGQAVLSELSDSRVEEQRALGGRWQFSGGQQVAGAGGVPRCARDSRVDERELFACAAVPSGRSQSLTGAGGVALLDSGSPAVPIDLAGQDHVAGCAGRQGVGAACSGDAEGFSPPDGGA